MKLSLINVFRNANFKKLDWLPDLFFRIGFFVTVLATFWFQLLNLIKDITNSKIPKNSDKKDY